MQWFRSHHGAPTDPLWLSIGRRAGVAPGMVASIWWALMDHASQQDDRGNIEGFDVETIAAFFGYEENDVHAVIDALRDKGRIDGNTLKNWEKRQPKSDDSGERVKRHRAKKKQDVTPCNGDVTECNALDKNRTDTDRTDIKPPVVPLASQGDKSPRRKPPAIPLPENFPDREARDWARENGYDPPHIEAEAEAFREYWLSPDAKGSGKKRDWPLTWKNWLRRNFNGRSSTRSRSEEPHNRQLETSRESLAEAFGEDLRSG